MEIGGQSDEPLHAVEVMLNDLDEHLDIQVALQRGEASESQIRGALEEADRIMHFTQRLVHPGEDGVVQLYELEVAR